MVYNINKPASGDNLSVSQGDIQGNFSTANTVMAIDHYPFNNLTANAGRHKQVQMPVLGAIPAGLAASTANIYGKSANGAAQLFYTNGVSTNEYQLTRATTSAAVFTNSFGQLKNNYTPQGSGVAVGVTYNGGWSFLPGGLLYQYGSFVPNPISTLTGTIEFPASFTTAASIVITLTLICTNAGTTATRTMSIRQNTVTTDQFQWQTDQTSAATQMRGFFWTAVGN